MITPSPLFTTKLSKPLEASRLDRAAIVSQAKLIDPEAIDANDPRLEGDASLVLDHLIIHGAELQAVVEWPDLVLARVFVPFGRPLGETFELAMVQAYERGRSQLESIYLQHLPPAGQA